MDPYYVSDEESMSRNPSYGRQSSSQPFIGEDLREEDQRYFSNRKGLRAQASARTVCNDITDRFKSAVTEIANGQLRVEGGFTLVDAIGAIEIMDPKMDSGYQAPNEPTEGFDVLTPLTFRQTIGVMFEILRKFAAWQQGFLLTQTILTSAHIDNLLRCDSFTYDDIQFSGQGAAHRRSDWSLKALRIFCIAIVKAISLSIETIKNSQAPIWEEEDISTQTYGLTLFGNVDVKQVVFDAATLKEESRQTVLGVTSQQLYCLSECVGFSCAFLELTNSAICTSECSDDCQTCTKWDAALKKVEIQIVVAEMSMSTKLPVSAAFSPKLQQRYASSTPLRGMVNLPDEQVMTILQALCDGAKWAAKNMKLCFQCEGASFDLASRYVQENVARNSQLAYLIAIASGPLWKTQENDWVARLRHEVHTQWLIEDPQRGTSRFGGHGRNDALPSPGLGDTTQLQQYLVDAVLEDGGYMDYYRAMWSNVSRRRRTLCHVIKTFGNIENKAVSIDTALTAHNPYLISKPLQTWALLKRLDAAILVVELGFQLQIYEVHEYALMYCLLKTLTNCWLNVYKGLPWYIRGLLTENAEYFHVILFMSRSWYFYHCLLLDIGIVKPPPSSDGLPINVQENAWKMRVRPFTGISELEIPSWEQIKEIYDPNLRPPRNSSGERLKITPDLILSCMSEVDPKFEKAEKFNYYWLNGYKKSRDELVLEMDFYKSRLLDKGKGALLELEQTHVPDEPDLHPSYKILKLVR